jgi:hypothetical protein
MKKATAKSTASQKVSSVARKLGRGSMPRRQGSDNGPRARQQPTPISYGPEDIAEANRMGEVVRRLHAP